VKRKGKVKAQAQWWLGLGLALALAYLGWALVIKPTSFPTPELPGYPCPGKSDTYSANDISVTYRASGCAGLTSGHAVDVAHTFGRLDHALQQLRLPPLPRGLRVGLYTGRAGYELLGQPGGPRAIVIRTSSRKHSLQAEMLAHRAFAELALQEAAPGLDERSRRALAGALAVIASQNDDVARSLALTLNAHERRALGLLTRHGPFYLSEMLERRCRDHCRWRPLG